MKIASRTSLMCVALVLVAGCARPPAVANPCRRVVYTGVLEGAGAFPAANPDPAPELPRGVYEGRYVSGFETSDFYVCGSFQRWWASGDLCAVTDFENLHPERLYQSLYLKVVATPSATGNHGHLGQYVRELEVEEILELREYRESDCPRKEGTW